MDVHLVGRIQSWFDYNMSAGAKELPCFERDTDLFSCSMDHGLCVPLLFRSFDAVFAYVFR